MLAQVNRITLGSDYKSVVRRGVRVVGPHIVTYLRRSTTAPGPDAPARFGFIVAKNVGNAVRRNRVRRRLKAASFALLDSVPPGTDIVFRALPAAYAAEWFELTSEVQHGVTNAVTKGHRPR
ncbi:ribonuclease P protein component [Cryobacterium melibiosiphilum]|uniref:Ribonuclease P protein component n=1 Tax=Cryobacterium melibiosiphilum TaxID=995039 RepID=A0A3A5MLU6_9MICO|nr:ribonuclease P protein component [Cryobacterium melibiosiphilum]RJT87046.1 ribonuclease P protein component [Cryobacterium melibiosiphilum]